MFGGVEGLFGGVEGLFGGVEECLVVLRSVWWC